MAAPAPQPAVTEAVDARFCPPEATAFAVTKTISVTGRDFTVTDAAGRSSLLLDAARRPVLTMQDSTFLMGTRWEVFSGGSTSRRNLLFTVVKSSAFQVRTKIYVFLAGNAGEQVPDFVIRGSYYDGAFTLSQQLGRRHRSDHPPKHRRGCTAREAHIYCKNQPRHRPCVHPGTDHDSGPDASPQLER